MQTRLKNESEFTRRFGVDDIPQADWAWSIIDGKDGGKSRHEDCIDGYHEYVWMDEAWDYVCFFCLTVEDFASDESIVDSEDDWLIPCLKGIGGGKMDDDLEPKSDSDSQNEDDE